MMVVMPEENSDVVSGRNYWLYLLLGSRLGGCLGHPGIHFLASPKASHAKFYI